MRRAVPRARALALALVAGALIASRAPPARAADIPIAAAAPAARAPAADADLVAAPALFQLALGDDVDVVVFPAALRPGPRPTVVAATLAHARPDAVLGVLLDPAAIRAALPALVRADVVSTRAGPRPDAWPDRLIEWELEIPLFNLKGRGWLMQRGDTVELDLTDGAFAPGRVRVLAVPATATGVLRTSILVCALQIDARTSNWIFRRVARHDPWSETAMSAATAWVLARALALGAESPHALAPTRPTAPIRPPPARALDGATLGSPALAALRARGRLGLVRRTPDGRLAFASVAVTVPDSAAARARIATPETWQVFPGWKTVKRVARAIPGVAPPADLFRVDDNVAFVDLDATWALEHAPAPRATAVDGDIRGAVFGWDVVAGDRVGTSLAVLSLHPHLDAAGFVERRLIATEPLMEHGVAIAMAYADAAAVADALVDAPADIPVDRDARATPGARVAPAGGR